ncbi:MAG: efflux RND transporter periplasmic adaptor subunit [Verrucomicrobiales bacterium]
MRRRRRRKWPWILTLLAAAGGIGWTYFNHQEKKEAVPEYETATVDRGEITKEVLATGDLNPLKKVEIGSQISGTIWKLHVDFNSAVKKDDILCELDPATYKANYAQAVAEQASAEADRDLQRRTVDRKQQLMKKEFFAKADFDKAESDLRRAEAQVQLSAARVSKAKVDLDRCTILAPIDGVIVDRTAEIGQTIAASFSAPKLFVMANDLGEMQINAKVSEADIGFVAPDQKVKFTVDAYQGEDFFGKVVQVRNSPIAEENVVNYDAIIEVKNPELKLKPGMTATVRVITGERTNALRVPNAALRFKPAAKGGRDGAGRPPGEARPPRDSGGSGSRSSRDGGGQRSSREGGSSARPSRDGAGAAAGTGAASTPRPRRREPRLQEASDQKQVYLPPKTPGGEPLAVKVKLGLRDNLFTEIIEGLAEGDSVITLLKPSENAANEMTNPFGGMGGGRRSR